MNFTRLGRPAALAGTLAVGALATAGWWASRSGGAGHAGRVDFNRDIRPILNQNCTGCHGGVKAESGVSFVFREEAMGVGESGRRIIVPGRPDASELIARVTSTDPDFRMPEAGHAPPLPAAQIELLRKWVEEGAQWDEHWAFIPPKPQALPTVRHAHWARGPIDRFVLARLEAEGLAPSPEADRSTLLRRASLDLTGLPPTPEEIAAFLADRSPTAYEKQVDRLLASPRYGERWTSVWLDLARYADTKGYERDAGRGVWPYRDWVVSAFNRNLPYDRFLIDQMAGDLLPNPTLGQVIATSFQRQTQVNDEAGTDDEEFRLSAVLDRVSTSWSAVNGVTFGCVQCHSHPYDPIRHQEYYRFIAFFNNTRDADYPDDRPFVRVPNDAARHDEAFRQQRERTALRRAVVDSGLSMATPAAQWTRLPLASASATIVTRDSTRRVPASFDLRDGEVRVLGNVPGGAHYDLVTEPAAGTVTALRVEVPPQDSVKARQIPEQGFIITRVDAWVVRADGREEPVAFRHHAHDSYDEPSPPAVAVIGDRRRPPPLDPSGFAADPKLFRTRWMVAVPAEPLRLEAGARLKVRVTHGGRIATLPTRPVSRLRLATSGDPRWVAFAGSPQLARDVARIAAIDAALDSMPGTDLPVMEELPARERRDTRLFDRGNFLERKGPSLTPDVPALFPALPKGAPRDRLTLARWLVAPGHPLTARVAVNRYWEQLFGVGIVETLEDFGSVGEPPSHPELLDWLALRFQNDLKWDMKRLLHELVTSAAYRQSAKATPALLAKDPRNRLVARGPRQRLTAEMVRDQALLAAGLLSRKMGGPPVMPPQPAGLWASVYSTAKWVDAQGEDRFRRAVYTYLKRSSPYPSFVTFDASHRDVAVLRRIPTNTPLQALVTLNDPVYHEAAVALAGRMQREAGGLDAGLALGMRATVSRDPSAAELAVLRRLYESTLNGAVTAAAPRELPALTAVASAMLNLDAALSR